MKKKMMAWFLTIVMAFGMLVGIPQTRMRVQAEPSGLTVTGGVENTDYKYDSSNSKWIIMTETPLTISGGSWEQGIYINDGVSANLTLSGVEIDLTDDVAGKPGIEIADDSKGNVTIKLSGYNEIYAENAPAIQKNGNTSTGTLTIDDVDDDDTDDDKLCAYTCTAVSDKVGDAAIGGSAGNSGSNITINGGILHAICSSCGAGIGGGSSGDGNNIVINGGNVCALMVNDAASGMIAYSNINQGAAIGGGYCGNGNNITITGGNVIARFYKSGDTLPEGVDWVYRNYFDGPRPCRGGAGIGGGNSADANSGNAKNILITGGTVIATGSATTGSYDSAGIGAGSHGNATEIQITGGHVTATGAGSYGAGIGTGGMSDMNKTTDITISGGTVVANGASCAPGIGVGYAGNAKVCISGGSVQAIPGTSLYINAVEYADDIGVGSKTKHSYSGTCTGTVVNTSNVSLVKKPFATTANTNVSGKLICKYSDETEYAYNTTGMVSDDDGVVYLWLPSDVNVYQDVSDEELIVEFNDSTSQKSWYNEPVDITAEGYTISDTENGNYDVTYTFTETASKTLYFRGASGKVTAKEITVSIDKTAPTAILQIDDVTVSNSAINTNSSVKRVKLASATAKLMKVSDDGSGVSKVEYAVSTGCYTTEAKMKAVLNDAWKTGSTSSDTTITLTSNTNQAVYVRITDVAGNVRYMSSPVYYNDTVAPTVTMKQNEITDTTAKFSLSFNEASEYIYVLLESDSSVSSWETIQTQLNNSKPGGISTGTVRTSAEVSFNDLKPNTKYQLYVAARDVLSTISGGTDNNYSGVATSGYFDTSKAYVTLSGVSVANTVYDGSQHGYSGTPVWSKNGAVCNGLGTKVLYEGTDGTSYSSATAPTKAGTYKVTLTADSSNYLGEESFTYTIAKADLINEMTNVAWHLDGKAITDTNNVKITEDGSRHTVSVDGYPKDILKPVYTGTYSTATPGTHTASVTFELVGDAVGNYNIPTMDSLNWQIIDRITPDMSNVKWVYKQGITEKTYQQNSTVLYMNGKKYTVEVTGLPEGIEVSYSGSCEATTAGRYMATATFEVTDSSQYKTPEKTSMTLEWEICKKTATLSAEIGYSKIRANDVAQSHFYDINEMLESAGVNATELLNPQYSCEKGSGSILSDFPSIDSNTLMMTLPVAGYLSEGISQKVIITIKSDNYNDMTVVLTLNTISAVSTIVSWAGATSMASYGYDGQSHGYTGTIAWVDENKNILVNESGTDVTYVGVGGTSYNSTGAPTEAGTYQVIFKVKDELAYSNYVYNSKTLTFKITPYDLTAEMSNMAWYMDGTTKITSDNYTITEDGNSHTVSLEGYSSKVTPNGPVTFTKSEVGKYTAEVTFTVGSNYYLPSDMCKQTLHWSIEPKETEDDNNGNDDSGDHSSDNTGDNTGGNTGGSTGDNTGGNTGGNTSGETEDSNDGEDGSGMNQPVAIVGDTKTEGTNTFKVTSATTAGGTVEYTGATSKMVSKVVIPATIIIEGQSYKVTSIKAGAFSGYKKLTKVTIPSGVTTIGANAFKDCVKLTNITIPNSVTSIGSGAFSGCKALKKVKLSNAITQIPKNAFNGCSKLSSITIPTKVTKIGDRAFYKCISFKKITIPKNVTIIGKEAFSGCKQLKTITIKSKKLKKVGTKTIKGIYKKATIKCPGKTYVKKYKKLFKSKTGYIKSMKIK